MSIQETLQYYKNITKILQILRYSLFFVIKVDII